MAWFRNFYHCDDCDTQWEDEWSCSCDDECPTCGSSDWSPYESEDLTFVVEASADDPNVTIYESPLSAEDDPEYVAVAVAPSTQAATAYISWRMAAYWDATL